MISYDSLTGFMSVSSHGCDETLGRYTFSDFGHFDFKLKSVDREGKNGNIDKGFCYL